MKTSFFRVVIQRTLLAVLMLSAATAHANTLLNLHPDYPMVVSNYISIDYQANPAGYAAGLGKLTATGFAQDYKASAGSPQTPVTNGSFSLTAVIEKATGIGQSGTLLISGNIGSGIQTLFQSNTLLNFGSGPNDKFEFLFQKGTSLGSQGTIGVVMDGREILNFSDPVFTSNFQGDGFGKADAFPVPTPNALTGGSALLCLIGAVSWFRRRRLNCD